MKYLTLRTLLITNNIWHVNMFWYDSRVALPPWMRHFTVLEVTCCLSECRLKAFAGSQSREISLKDGSIRDLTCALIISRAPLQISLKNQQTANHDSLPLLTGSCFTTTTNTHIPHYVPRLRSHWSKTLFPITAAPICLATIEKTGREKLNVRLKGSISGHKYEYSETLYIFALKHPFTHLHCIWTAA